jgi:hypothetical protein
MDIPTFPSIHSCEFCRKLGIEDRKPEYVINATPRLSPWSWRRVVEGYEQMVQNIGLKKRKMRPAKLHYSSWEDYEDGYACKVFDCTVKALKQASKARCCLSTKLLHAFQDQVDDASLLVVRFMGPSVEFGLALPTVQTIGQLWQRRQDGEVMGDARHSFHLISNPSTLKDFQMPLILN